LNLTNASEFGPGLGSAYRASGRRLVLFEAGNALPRNFFGLIHKKSIGNYRYIVDARIVAKISLATSVMHGLRISVAHRGLDNVSSVQISGGTTQLVETAAEIISELLLFLSL
jgi:hypothetical protein